MHKIWYLEDIEDEKINNNITNGEFKPLIEKILLRRGLYTEKEINEFLYGTLEELYDPFKLKDMETAVKRIIDDIDEPANIIVYGDYDVDGITGTALLYNYFKNRLGINIDYYIPDRQQEGYGLNLNAIKKIVKKDYDLLITVDCGITAINEIEYAGSQGLDIIITDHHQPADNLPPALAIIDPHRKDETYPFPELAGVGVAFKLCMGLEKQLYGTCISQYLLNELDLIALGSVADIVTLRGENRILIKEGIKTITKSKKPGLQALVHKLNLDDCEINAGRIGYILAPPLNAAGRMEDAKMGVKLFTTEKDEEAEQIADKLVALNRERQKEEQKTLVEAEEMISEEVNLEQDNCIVLASSNWHQGVIGIVASRIVEKYYRPTILIAVDGNIGKGSCRSIEDLNLYLALKTCEGDLKSFGGHAQAAGLTITCDKIKKFKMNLNDYLEQILSRQDLIPRLRLDELIEADSVDRELYEELQLLKPFGVGNPRPRFLINKAKIERCYCVGNNDRHLKLQLANGIEGIAFGYGDFRENIQDKQVDLAFTISLNKWKGTEKVQLNIKDINLRSHDKFYPIHFISNDWLIADKRGNDNHFNYIKHLVKCKSKIAVYLNNKKTIDYLLHKFKNTGIFIKSQEESQKEIAEFKKVKKGILFFSKPPLKDKVKIDDLVFLSIPFSLEDMIKMITGFELFPRKLHFLFGEEDYYTNQKLIKNKLPTARYLRRLYLKLKSICHSEIGSEKIYGQLAKQELKVNEKLFNTSLTIFSELGLIDKNSTHIKLLQSPEDKLDLSYSIRYNEITAVVEQFNELAQLIFSDNIFKLMRKLKMNIKGVE